MMKRIANIHGGWSVSLACAAIILVTCVTSADGQTQTPGQIAQFDPSLNLVDSVITQDPTGNIGIGTTTPIATLDVAGGNVNLANSTPTIGNVLKNGTLFLHNSGTDSTFIGIGAGNLTPSGLGRNTAMGVNALSGIVFGSDNTAVGSRALQSNTGDPSVFASGTYNTAVGSFALSSNTLGTGNTAVGAVALRNNTGDAAANGAYNTALGFNTLPSNTTGFSNTAVGVSALASNTTSNCNTATGFDALLFTTTMNTVLGTRSGQNNTASGARALLSNTTGSNNTATGYNALYSNSATSSGEFYYEGFNNTADGVNALVFNTFGYNNTASGYNALRNNTTGTNITAVGAGADVSGQFNNATAIGAGAIVNASNKIRLGDSGVTVIEGQVPYTYTSDRNRKEQFRAVDGDQVLRKIGGLTLTSWNYIGHDPQQFRHYGPVAQEFFAAFGHDGVGTVGTPTTINSGDLDGILLIAVQALQKQNAELHTRLAALEQAMQAAASPATH